MTHNKLTINFNKFMKRINPSKTYVETASSAHSTIRSLIESRDGPAADLRIRTFVQGSYGRKTAIHSINDVDVVALCSLTYKESANYKTRNQIYQMIADSISDNRQYHDKVAFNEHSLCIKIKLKGIIIEVLPALRAPGGTYDSEPFYIFRPDNDEKTCGSWGTTYARKHQELLSEKNNATDGLFIPLVKIIKHIREITSTIDATDAVSFHIECLLYALSNSVYVGSIAECIERTLTSLSGFTPPKALVSGLRNPCGDEQVFNSNKWSEEKYSLYHNSVLKWCKIAQAANNAIDNDTAITEWKKLLGDTYFPRSQN